MPLYPFGHATMIQWRRGRPTQPLHLECSQFLGTPCRSVALPSWQAHKARADRIKYPDDWHRRIQLRGLAPLVYFCLYAKKPGPAVFGPYWRAP